jgi:hypothetical protein
MSMTTATPDFIGRYLVGGKPYFYAVNRDELDRGAPCFARIIGSFQLAAGKYVLTVSMTPEIAQLAPFEAGVQMLGLIGMNADLSPYDAARVEALVRLFDVAAICGVDKAVLDGLKMIGHDAEKIFKGRIVWARPDAYELVAAMPGVTARRVAEFGPALGLECAAGEGLHMDGRDWALSDAGGTIRLTSRQHRISPLEDLDTGVKGKLMAMPCSCGNRDPRVILG